MPTPMKYRDVVKALARAGCVSKGGTNHEKWLCPCGQHIGQVPRHRTITAGVVGDLIKKLPCLPEGWLQ